MGIGYALKQLAQGNFANAFNGVWVSDDLLAAQDATGNTLQAKVASQQANGLIDSQQAMDLYTKLSPNTNSDAYWNSTGPSPLDTFNQSLTDEAAAIGQFGSSAINRVTGLGFKMIPWQVWIALLALLMIWLYPLWRPFASALFARSSK